ncbi:hypothetical protein ABEB36_013392 [Hypothenemus hampei]|uniref:THAP-type domain-containing protein n=1 Tax=Hypothenemus hampei TaxID=57062 RepID=A0ABD1E839_HYPHA
MNCTVCGKILNNKSIVSFHRFPKEKLLRQKWLIACGLEENTIKSSSLICSKHFRTIDFDETYWPKKIITICGPNTFVCNYAREMQDILESTSISSISDTVITSELVAEPSVSNEMGVRFIQKGIWRTHWKLNDFFSENCYGRNNINCGEICATMEVEEDLVIALYTTYDELEEDV